MKYARKPIITQVKEQYNEDTEQHEAGFFYEGDFYSFSDCMAFGVRNGNHIIKNTQYDGYFGETYFSSIYVKLLGDDRVKVARVVSED